MLFTTPLFFFIYLPLVLAGFLLIGRYSANWAAAWLFAASVVFYGYWMPPFTALLLASIVFNFLVGRQIARSSIGKARGWLIAGIVGNLGALAYYKYAGFLVDNVNQVFGLGWDIGKIILPIGISFFTFTQIAYLADTYQKGTREYSPAHYGLFVTYFPHLIAGPVLHHAQMMPQFGEARIYRADLGNLAAGLSIFAIGLAKKIILADGLAPYADAVFDGAAAGRPPTSAEAWIGTLAYTLQLYFDFSGYSDMAIGLSWMFNIRLPHNFNSPYRARNIIDFWRRWHMTLSAFLRDYLYIPLGGNRRGPLFRHINLMLTMLLGGLWHGANWTFVVWGGLHGLFLIANHAFSSASAAWLIRLRTAPIFQPFAWLLTFLAVALAWVFFRATSFDAALRILSALAGGVAGSGDMPLLANQGLDPARALLWLAALLPIVALAPNSNAMGERLLGLRARHPSLPAAMLGAALVACVLLVVINGARDAASAFIYFNF